MAHTKKNLADKIVELCLGNWEKEPAPLLLSQLGPSLKSAGFDYKAILGLQGLRKFIEFEVEKTTIVQHPTQYAKVGVIPAAKSFSFASEPTSPKAELSNSEQLRKSRHAFYGFIKAISEYPPEEIDGVTIPARVIVRLLEGK